VDGVVITGTGAVSPLGTGVPRLTQGLLGNEVAVRPAPWAAPDSAAWWTAVPDFRPLDWMSEQVEAGTDLFAQFALAAAEQAVRQAGLTEFDPRRTAVVHGTSMGGMRALAKGQYQLDMSGPDAIDRKTVIKIWPNMAAAQMAMRYGLHGPQITVCTACASSIDAIGTAARLIAEGRADVAIAGGTEGGFPLASGEPDGDFVPVNFYAQARFAMETGSTDRLRASLPFDVARSGIVTGEGSAMVVLERAAHARARSATPLAEVVGYASLADGFHPSSPDPTGQWEAAAMADAISDAGLTAGQIGALIAHGTATPKGDTAEIRAINAVHGGRPGPLPVTSLKGHLGHTGASAGAMGVIAGVTALTTGAFPNTAGTREVDPEADFLVVTKQPAEVDAAYLQVNAFGFGGQDSSLVLRQITERVGRRVSA
jgi:3-oxoacyl-[acyl-carrier-protein] synthase II